MDRALEDFASIAQTQPETLAEPAHDMERDMKQNDHIRQRVRESKSYAQNLYAAMCNTDWQKQDTWEILRNQTWSCSWRSAGGIVADLRGEGDYMDWYCSGMMTGHPDDDLVTESYRPDAVPEGVVTEEIRQDLLSIGWRQAG